MNAINQEFMAMRAYLEQYLGEELAPKPTVVKAWKVNGSYQVTMMAEMSDGAETRLFCYYPDEVSFSVSEVVGMTKSEAGQLFMRKDTTYLRS